MQIESRREKKRWQILNLLGNAIEFVLRSGLVNAILSLISSRELNITTGTDRCGYSKRE